MSTLTEIETAADNLPVEQKQELIHFLLARLHGDRAEWPAPRDIPKKKIEEWIADDEAGYRNYLAGA